MYPCAGTPGCAWDAIDSGAPTVGLTIANPDSGPGAQRDPEYATQVMRTSAAGVAVLGYVHTSYGARNASVVAAEVARYREWYNVTQIFFDEASTACADEPYYAALAALVRSAGGPTPAVVINPGTNTDACYAPTADVIVGFEDDAAAYAVFAPAPWTLSLAPARVWHIVYGAAAAAAPEIAALSRARNAAWVFVTDRALPNPYGALPTYFADEVAWVAGGATGSPSPSASRAPSRTARASATARASRSSSRTAAPTRSGTRTAAQTRTAARTRTPSRTGTRSSPATRSASRSVSASPKAKRARR